MNVLKQLRKIDKDLERLQNDLAEGLPVPGEDTFQAERVAKIRVKLKTAYDDTAKAGDAAGIASTQIHGSGTGED